MNERDASSVPVRQEHGHTVCKCRGKDQPRLIRIQSVCFPDLQRKRFTKRQFAGCLLQIQFMHLLRHDHIVKSAAKPSHHSPVIHQYIFRCITAVKTQVQFREMSRAYAAVSCRKRCIYARQRIKAVKPQERQSASIILNISIPDILIPVKRRCRFTINQINHNLPLSDKALLPAL